MDAKELPVLDRTALAEAVGLGWTAKTVSEYLSYSKPGGRYENHPFPEPDGYIGRGPWWLPERVDEVRRWAEGRRGRGVGGGRPRKAKRPLSS